MKKHSRFEVNLWADKSFVISFPSKELHQRITRGLQFPEPLSAVFHEKSGELEFVYSFLAKNDVRFRLAFAVIFQSKEFGSSPF
ncbi:MAG TPA: hypothetical protein PK523_12340 [Elusimicrobiales bacterium]|nr:hypothetical protein [Elusimicrobiales bacterium]